jgi:hypothetical protein
MECQREASVIAPFHGGIWRDTRPVALSSTTIDTNGPDWTGKEPSEREGVITRCPLPLGERNGAADDPEIVRRYDG